MISCLLALAPLSPAFQDTDEKLKLRITPIVQVVQSAAPAVVFIQTDYTKDVQDIFGRIFARQFSGSGSGVVILKEGFIITNYHVVRDAQRITVSFDKQYDDEEYPAQLISFVEREDLALLKINREKDFPVIPLGSSSDLMPGETVVAIGNPYGQTNTVSTGIISGLHRNVKIPNGNLDFDDLIQTDASINFGNSGGPLLNINGDLIGINSAINAQAQNIGFAIPVDRVKTVLEDQLLSPNTARTWLGFDIDESDHVRIANVVMGGPAAQAGLRTGDCIVSIAGRPVTNQETYRLARLGLSPLEEVEVGVERQGQVRQVRMKSWEKHDGILYQRVGLRVERLGVGPRPYVRVVDVRPSSPAAELGVEIGDLVTVARVRAGQFSRDFRITSREMFAGLVDTLPPRTELALEICRDLDANGVFERSELHQGTLTLQ